MDTETSIIGAITKEKKMENQNYKIGQKVLLNCKSFVSPSNLNDDGWFPVYGTVTGFTKKRIKAINEMRDTEGYYSPDNVREV